MIRKYAELLADVGLTYPQYLVMLALWAGSPQTVGDLGVRLGLDSGTLTPLLKRLEAAGHVARRRDTTDERRVNVELTEAGWALRERVTHVPEAVGQAIGLNRQDYEELRRILADMRSHLAPTSPGVSLDHRRAGSRRSPMGPGQGSRVTKVLPK